MFRSSILAHGAVLPVTRPLIFMAALLATACLFGCSGSSGVAGMDASQSRPEWAVQLLSTCSDTPAENCAAGYPYSIGADGLYRVGPGPQGQLLTGKLSQEEFTAFQQLYFEALSSAHAHSGDPVCLQAVGEIETTADKISVIAQNGSETEWIRTGERGFCSHLESRDSSKKLLAFMHESASKHYPVPFPDDDCDNARASLEALYGNVRSCVTDADCSFVDEAFQPIAQDYLTFLIKGDCTGAEPLVVGNRSLVTAKRSALLQELAHTQEACKKRSSTNCAGFSDFQPTRPAPICGGGICRARSG